MNPVSDSDGMDESYGKCRTCRLCIHKDDVWVCIPENDPTDPGSGCGRWRPGCCENCRNLDGGICSLTGEEMYPMDVCDSYDPSGMLRSVRHALLPAGYQILDAGLRLRFPPEHLGCRFRYPVVHDVVAQ